MHISYPPYLPASFWLTCSCLPSKPLSSLQFSAFLFFRNHSYPLFPLARRWYTYLCYWNLSFGIPSAHFHYQDQRWRQSVATLCMLFSEEDLAIIHNNHHTLLNLNFNRSILSLNVVPFILYLHTDDMIIIMYILLFDWIIC